MKLDSNFCRGCSCMKGADRNLQEEKHYTRFIIQRPIINELWRNKASLRHYIAYMEYSRKNLFNRWISLETVSASERTIRELCNKSSNLIFSKNGESVIVYNKAAADEGSYLIPNEFYDNRVYEQMDQQLKHYLKLIFTGYRVSQDGRYIKSRVGKKRIMELLGYNTEDSVYKLFQKLNSLGFTVFNKGKLFAVYYESYKVIDMQAYRKSQRPAAKLKEERVAGGEALTIPERNQEDRGELRSRSPDTG